VEPALSRPLSLLRAAGADELLEDLSITGRDARLFALHRMTFGDALRGMLPCQACATSVEFEVSIGAILERIEEPREITWSGGGCSFRMRPVTTRDLAGILSAPDPRRRLLQLCTAVDSEDAPAAPAAWENDAVEHFNRLNRDAETLFTLACPACGETVEADLDIARFFWMEVHHAAVTLLREVHELASAYGWCERDILGMNSARRAMYLHMVRA
jgi:hypothetical protein